MHVPDGFINAPVSVATGAVAVGAVALSLRGARRELDAAGTPEGGRTAPLAGLVAAFVFAVQMLNFPVAAGVSGHLLGGALAAVLVGPYTGVLCVSVVLLVQAVLFADGGLTALGVNITTMGAVGVPVAYGVFLALLKVLPGRRSSVTAATFAAALVSVPVAATAFTALYAVGGTAEVSLGKVFTAMFGVHTLIGLGEAVITALTVGAVLSVRPDLVHGARGLTAPLLLRDASGAVTTAAPAPAPAASGARVSRRGVWAGGLAAALLCAGVVSFYASASPDGLEHVAAGHGIDEKARDHQLADWPLADYGVADVTDARLSGGLAGVIGVGATLAVGTGVFVAARRRRATGEAAPQGQSHGV
jgi:cobalt/nickel transport system permease protein